MLKLFLNVAFALAGGTGIFLVNLSDPQASQPVTAGCVKACDLKQGECRPCPNGKWCCLDADGKPQCCDRAEGGKCVPCPMEKCPMNGCTMADKSAKSIKPTGAPCCAKECAGKATAGCCGK